MFGHISPPGLYHELQTLASIVGNQSYASACFTPHRPLTPTPCSTPLSGLRVFVTHIKEALIPHPTGKTAREIIMSELRELEKRGGLGVEFIDVKKGDRIGQWG
jgi:cAMP phosphodiesterase